MLVCRATIGRSPACGQTGGRLQVCKSAAFVQADDSQGRSGKRGRAHRSWYVLIAMPPRFAHASSLPFFTAAQPAPGATPGSGACLEEPSQWHTRASWNTAMTAMHATWKMGVAEQPWEQNCICRVFCAIICTCKHLLSVARMRCLTPSANVFTARRLQPQQYSSCQQWAAMGLCWNWELKTRHVRKREALL